MPWVACMQIMASACMHGVGTAGAVTFVERLLSAIQGDAQESGPATPGGGVGLGFGLRSVHSRATHHPYCARRRLTHPHSFLELSKHWCCTNGRQGLPMRISRMEALPRVEQTRYTSQNTWMIRSRPASGADTLHSASAGTSSKLRTTIRSTFLPSCSVR